ncbi:hypothetical protein E4U13_006212 [Claviceps humidiphila]|uniref:rRNA biogenesis protein RRP36 n=1 Tax=Claviceps humidiphila TaxID=1294629 RepID=A0A9P7U084_9HYPO|nr:hypothetical protein E4U13_006212 [Claviceps humidiphila]
MPVKRKMPSLGLQRRVRPRREDEQEPELVSASASEQSDSDDGSPDGDDSQADDQQDSEDGSSVTSESHAPKVDLSSVSFGALARAQASLPTKSKTSAQTPEETTTTNRSSSSLLAKSSKPPAPKRSSKHAPQEQTSKRPVKRLREIIPDPRRKARDPRFDPLAGKLDETRARKAYAFLDEYRETEMADLRAQIKKSKNPLDKEALKRQLMSMESRKKAQKKKDEEQTLLAEHRAKEKELVAQGKTPFYLKRSEQKKQLLVERFEKMSKSQVDRAIERKRKKVVGKEKKELGQLVRRR